MNARTLLSCAASLVLCAHAAWCAEGAYQQTKDGRTKVWNGNPQPGDTATWSGGRDENGYASGYGTLAWYSVKEPGSDDHGKRSGKPKIFARYTGRLVHGKLDGIITAETKGVLSHAKFADGRKVSHWVAGRAPAREQDAAENVAANESKTKTHRNAAKHETPSPVAEQTAEKPTVNEPAAPAEAPARPVDAVKPLSTPPPVVAATPRPSPPPIVASSPRPTPPPLVVAPRPNPDDLLAPTPTVAASPSNTKKLKDVDPSLRSLVGPPSSLLPDKESPSPEAGSSPAEKPSGSESPSPEE